jgi:pimeloyl-ACP methyl ester carboxylesterase
MAGFPITAAAEKAPHRIEKLIYLCAHGPAPGKSLSDMRKLVPEQPLIEAIRMAEDGASFTFDPALAESRFYHDCPPGTLDYALPRLVPQAVAPNSVPVETGENYARVPRHYIRCALDNAVPPSLQDLVTRDFPPENLHHLQTGHSPFFADPEGLARLIDQIIRK